jgi:cysteine synthase A
MEAINTANVNPNLARFSLIEAIGKTPLIEVEKIYVKLECTNPTGSIKDRIALEMINAAEKEGKLKKGYTIIEPTSGNTGIALAMIAAFKGYKMIVVMPENMSKERRQIIRAFGARIILTSKSGSLTEAIEKAKEIAKAPKFFMPQQFSNPNNVIAQQQTGREILQQVGDVDAIVAGVGTGGTLMGIAGEMRKSNPQVKVIAVEPEEAAVILGGSNPIRRDHKIQGIGDGFIPQIIDINTVDDVITVKSQDAINMTKKLCEAYGLMVGISSGANMIGALKVAKKFKRVVTVFPDRGERYLSMDIYRNNPNLPKAGL